MDPPLKLTRSLTDYTIVIGIKRKNTFPIEINLKRSHSETSIFSLGIKDSEIPFCVENAPTSTFPLCVAPKN